jgi:hypothetical protein
VGRFFCQGPRGRLNQRDPAYLDRLDLTDAGKLARIKSSAEQRPLAVLTVYGDESHDEKRKRVFAVGGLLGGQEDWDLLRIAWEKRTGGNPFHAADCESNARQYKENSDPENKRLYKDLTQLLVKSKLMGFGTALCLPDYNTAFRHDLPDEPYFWCMSEVIRYFGLLAHLSIPRERIKFLFDRKTEIEHNAASIYSYILSKPEWMLRPYLEDQIGFSSRESVGVQAADLVARETMKHLDNRMAAVRRRTRQSFAALGATGRFRFRFYEQDVFEAMKRKMADMDMPTIPEYLEWLRQFNLTDNASNRIKYLWVAETIHPVEVVKHL